MEKVFYRSEFLVFSKVPPPCQEITIYLYYPRFDSNLKNYLESNLKYHGQYISIIPVGIDLSELFPTLWRYVKEGSMSEKTFVEICDKTATELLKAIGFSDDKIRELKKEL